MHSIHRFAIVAAAAMFATSSAWAVTLNLVDSSVADPETAVINAIQASSPGFTIVPGSVQFIGRVADGNEAQTALFSNFNLAPNSGASPTVTIDDGVLLTNGIANLPSTNTVGQWDHDAVSVLPPSTGSNALLEALSSLNTFDQNVIQFEFTLDNPSDTGLAFDLVFASDEFPTQSVTDIFGFFVDGQNYAVFPNGDLIGNNASSQFIDNPVGGGVYDIEYNGFTQNFTVIGSIDPMAMTHTAVIAIADTNDSIFDSGAFIANLRATNQGPGIIGPGAPTMSFAVPAIDKFGSMLLILSIMVLALGVLRNRLV